MAKKNLDEVPSRTGFLSVIDSLPSVRRLAELHFTAMTDRRLAATALAIRLYVVDHNGKWPIRLDQLVPDYLPAVPIDAMSVDGKSISYLPRPEHPVLYSVGSDSVDDGGCEAAKPGEHGELDEWHRLDRVFYLSLRPRDEIFVPYSSGAGAMAGPPPGFDSRPPWEREHPASQP